MFDGQFTNVFLSCPSPPSGGQAYFHIYSWWCLIGLPELLHLLSGEYLLWYRQKLFYLSPQTNSPAILRGFDTFFCFVSYNTLESPLTARRSNQSILKEINPEYSSEGLMLKLKLRCFGHLMWSTNLLEKTLMLGNIEGQRKRGQQRLRWLGRVTNSMDSMDTRSEQTPGNSNRQGSLACCGPWGWKESDMT